MDLARIRSVKVWERSSITRTMSNVDLGSIPEPLFPSFVSESEARSLGIRGPSLLNLAQQDGFLEVPKASISLAGADTSLGLTPLRAAGKQSTLSRRGWIPTLPEAALRGCRGQRALTTGISWQLC
jgi:hypothetical protein